MLKVFLSYAKEDSATVKDFHDYLKTLGLDPWLDSERILPGQRWEREIDRALNEANVVILFMSPRSVDKRSFVTREANNAVQNLRYKKQDDIYIVPVLLEECEVPDDIAERAQYIDFRTPGAREKIVSALMHAADQQKIAVMNGVAHGPYNVFPRQLQEVVQGQPGHDISISYPEFQSATLEDAAKSLSAIFAGRAHDLLVRNRSAPWAASPDLHPIPDGELNYFHTNGRWDTYSITLANENNLSILYSCSWYGAGAAHSNEFFESINFSTLNGKLYPFELLDIFTDPEKALEIISIECRKSIAREYWERCGEEITKDEWWADSFQRATAPEISNFETFTIGEDKLTFYFAPYSVAAYSFGTWFVDVSFYDLREVLKRGNESPLQSK